MTDDPPPKTPPDPAALLGHWSNFLDSIAPLVSATVARGFTEREARQLVVSFLVQRGNERIEGKP